MNILTEILQSLGRTLTGSIFIQEMGRLRLSAAFNKRLPMLLLSRHCKDWFSLAHKEHTQTQ